MNLSAKLIVSLVTGECEKKCCNNIAITLYEETRLECPNVGWCIHHSIWLCIYLNITRVANETYYYIWNYTNFIGHRNLRRSKSRWKFLHAFFLRKQPLQPIYQWWRKNDNWGVGHIFLHSCLQTVKTFDFKRN